MKLLGYIPVDDSVSTGEFYAKEREINRVNTNLAIATGIEFAYISYAYINEPKPAFYDYCSVSRK